MGNKKPNKQNPILAAFEAKLRKEFAETMAAYKAERDREFSEGIANNLEINLISFLISGNDLGIIGQKRSGLLLDGIFETRVKFCKNLLKDANDDPDFTYTKYDIATRLKSILGRENWEKHCHEFPMLREYWPWE